MVDKVAGGRESVDEINSLEKSTIEKEIQDLDGQDTDESKDISAKLIANEFSKVQTIFFEQSGKALQSIEDYILPEDYLYALNQTYGIKLRKEGYVNLTADDIESRKKNGMIESVHSIWEEHKDDGWDDFDSEEVCRYI